MERAASFVPRPTEGADLVLTLQPPVRTGYSLPLQGDIRCRPGWRVTAAWVQEHNRWVAALRLGPLPAETAGPRYSLRGLLGLLALPAEGEASLWASVVDPAGAQSRVILGQVAWKRPPLRLRLRRFRRPLRPLLLWSLGRSGSTAAMQWLSQHPSLVTRPRYPFEGRLAHYYLNRLAVAAQSYDTGDGTGDNASEENWRASPRNPLLFRLTQGAVGARFTAEVTARSLERLAGLAARDIEAGYRALAADQGKRGARFFVEKFQPAFIATLAAELYPRAKHLFLVRDPRDTLLSWQNFFSPDMTPEQLMESFAEGQVAPFLRAWRRFGDPAALLRYETLVADPPGAIAAALRGLGLPADPVWLAQAQGQIAARPLPGSHRTSASPQASIGRWHSEPPAWREAGTRAFADYLETFGYAAAAG